MTSMAANIELRKWLIYLVLKHFFNKTIMIGFIEKTDEFNKHACKIMFLFLNR